MATTLSSTLTSATVIGATIAAAATLIVAFATTRRAPKASVALRGSTAVAVMDELRPLMVTVAALPRPLTSPPTDEAVAAVEQALAQLDDITRRLYVVGAHLMVTALIGYREEVRYLKEPPSEVVAAPRFLKATEDRILDTALLTIFYSGRNQPQVRLAGWLLLVGFFLCAAVFATGFILLLVNTSQVVWNDLRAIGLPVLIVGLIVIFVGFAYFLFARIHYAKRSLWYQDAHPPQQ